MLPKYHIIINLIISLILLLFINPYFVLIIFLSSVLIDVDHYLYYVFEKKRISLKSAYNWFLIKKKRFLKLSNEEKKKHKHCIFIFHGIEFLLLLLFLSYFSIFFLYIFIGFSLHLIEDAIEAKKHFFLRKKLCLTYNLYHIFK